MQDLSVEKVAARTMAKQTEGDSVGKVFCADCPEADGGGGSGTAAAEHVSGRQGSLGVMASETAVEGGPLLDGEAGQACGRVREADDPGRTF